MKKKLARLSLKEDATWIEYFNFFLDTRVDNRPSRADRYAWKKVVECHPRLSKYDGCLP